MQLCLDPAMCLGVGPPDAWGHRGGLGTDFVPGKCVLWCSSGACRDFPFPVTFLISMGKSNAYMHSASPGRECTCP